MRKLKKISLNKKDVIKLDDFEMARVEGGGSTDLVSCYLCSELYNNCGSTTTKKTPLPGISSGGGGEPGAGCHP